MIKSSWAFSVVLVCMVLAWQHSAAQQLRSQNISSAGGGTSTSGTQRLISVVGQTIAYNSTSNTEPKAGFLQVARELINDNQPPVIAYTTTTQGITQGAAGAFTATITDNVSVASARIFYKPITSPASAFQNATMTAGASNAYSATPQTAWFDAMGMEYYITATDGSNNSARSSANGSYFAPLTTPTTQVPATAFTSGTKAQNYRIIAMPFSSNAGDAISTVFGASSGLPAHKSDKTVWRLAGYDAGASKFVEFPDLATFKRGEGYWFLVRNITTIMLGSKAAPSNNRSDLFKITLKPGWNMIGNPYPVAIKWSDVQAFTGNPTVGALNVYNGGFSTASDLAPFQGGFVNNTGGSDLVVTIPFSGQTALGGRQKTVGSDISASSWQVNLGIYQDETFNELGKFGMLEEVKTEAVEFNPPAFEKSPELNFASQNISLDRICKLMQAPSRESSWKFTARGSEGEPTELKWNNDLGNGQEPLYLLDEENLKLVNMRQEKSYSFSLKKDHRFSLFYGMSLEKVAPEKVSINSPFPNPMVGRSAVFQVGLPASANLYNVGIQIFDGRGTLVVSDQKSFSAGLHQLTWPAKEDAAAGMYYYKILVQSEKGVKAVAGKVILPE